MVDYIGDKLSTWLNLRLREFPSKHALAEHYGVSPGLVYHVLNTGKDSPTLRKQLREKHDIRFRRKRSRLIIGACPPELIEQFDAARDGRTRAELLSDLLDLADGKGEVV